MLPAHRRPAGSCTIPVRRLFARSGGPLLPESVMFPSLDNAGLKCCTEETIEEVFSKIKIMLDLVSLTDELQDGRNYARHGPGTCEKWKLHCNIKVITQIFRNWIVEATNFSGVARSHPGQTHRVSDIFISRTECLVDQMAEINTKCVGKPLMIQYMIHLRNSSHPNFVRDYRDDDPYYTNFFNRVPVVEFYANCRELLALADDWKKEIVVLHKFLNLRRSTRIKKPVTKYQAGGKN